MRKAFGRRRWLAIVSIALLSISCSRQDGSKIIGHWRAERFEVMSLKLPIAPELRISRDRLMAGTETALPVEAITQDGDEITLDLPMHVGLSFHLVDDNRMYIDLPLVDRIYYRRVAPDSDPRPVALVTPASAPPVASVPATADRQDRRAGLANPGEGARPPSRYGQALDALRLGDQDGAVRLLHQALEERSVNAALVQRAPEWDVMRGDVRLQALLARYGD